MQDTEPLPQVPLLLAPGGALDKRATLIKRRLCPVSKLQMRSCRLRDAAYSVLLSGLNASEVTGSPSCTPPKTHVINLCIQITICMLGDFPS